MTTHTVTRCPEGHVVVKGFACKTCPQPEARLSERTLRNVSAASNHGRNGKNLISTELIEDGSSLFGLIVFGTIVALGVMGVFG